MPPRKKDPLSAQRTKYVKLLGNLFEIACYGHGEDWVCRLTSQFTKPIASDMTDGYCPPLDLGLLWLRSFDAHCNITGYLRKALVKNSDELYDLIEIIQTMLPVDQVQPNIHIEVIGATRTWVHCFNGEQENSRF